MRVILFIIALQLISFSIVGQANINYKKNSLQGLDDEVRSRNLQERNLLSWEPIRENDVVWKKTVWRVIDVRQKMNHHFSYPVRPFVNILLDAVKGGEVLAFTGDDFNEVYANQDIAEKISSIDTIEVLDPYTYDLDTAIVHNNLDPDDIKRYRIKEIWYFDKETSTLKVRIVGLAPLRDISDSHGNFIAEEPLFWLYYPDAREYLSMERAFVVGNEAAQTSWEDILEMRLFDGFIYKESSVRDLRLKDYLSGTDLLLESERIENSLFNYEQDLWSR